MATLVFVHGAFAGAWKWERLVEPLRTSGHTVVTLDMPAMGEDRTPIAEATLDASVDRVRSQLAERPEPVVLVASSMGGVVCTQAAALDPDKVAGIVYVAGFVPQDGQSLIDLTQYPEGADDEIQANIVIEGDPPAGTMPREAARSAEYLETAEDDFEWAYARHRPQPVQPFEQAVQIPNGSFDRIPRAYVLCARDRSIPPALQRRMVAENGIEHVIELDTDHSPMLSRTAELAQAVDRLVARVREDHEAVR